MIPEHYKLSNSYGQTALIAPIETNNYPAAETILIVSYLAHVRDKERINPLHRYRDPRIMRLLIEVLRGRTSLSAEPELPNINAVDVNGQPPLHAACQRGNVETVKLLLEGGASVNTLSKSEDSPLVIATLAGKKQDRDAIVQLLVDHGADTPVVNLAGEDARARLKKSGNKTKAINILLYRRCIER